MNRETVAEAIAALLPRRKPTIAEAARLLDTSARTLQRRLAAEGFSYHELVDEVRLATARQLLCTGQTQIAEIAAALGYADPSSFSRAFMRWCGMPPRAYRRRQAEWSATGGSTGWIPSSTGGAVVGALEDTRGKP